MIGRLLLIVATAALPLPVEAQRVETAPNPATEIRRHMAVARVDGTPYYTVTSILALSDERSDRLLLIRDAKEQMWRISDAVDYPRHMVTQEITYVPTGEFVRVSFKLPLKAKTRLEAIAEGHPQIGDRESPLMKANPPMTVETRLVSRTAAESEWKNFEVAADLRSDVRTSLSTLFLDSVDRMRATLFRHSELGLASIDGLLQMLSHTPSCESPVHYSKLIELAPDCAFDKALGWPCSTEQQRRIAEGEKKGRTVRRY